jgi:hypothetical protein
MTPVKSTAREMKSNATTSLNMPCPAGPASSGTSLASQLCGGG